MLDNIVLISKQCMVVKHELVERRLWRVGVDETQMALTKLQDYWVDPRLSHRANIMHGKPAD
jgi:hypothetical protein